MGSITRGPAAAIIVALALCAGCGDDDGAAMCMPAGGPVPGGADTHCGSMVQPTDPMSCEYTPPDAGGVDGGVIDEEDYGPAMFNAEGDDDDCKYHVVWSSTPVCQGSDVMFTVTATNKTDGSPLTGAHPELEVFLDETHPAPNTEQTPTETSPGTYTVGPIRFDASGQWTVRFHFNDECSDIPEDSPHGHAAFFVSVP